MCPVSRQTDLWVRDVAFPKLEIYRNYSGTTLPTGLTFLRIINTSLSYWAKFQISSSLSFTAIWAKTTNNKLAKTQMFSCFRVWTLILSLITAVGTHLIWAMRCCSRNMNHFVTSYPQYFSVSALQAFRSNQHEVRDACHDLDEKWVGAPELNESFMLEQVLSCQQYCYASGMLETFTQYVK